MPAWGFYRYLFSAMEIQQVMNERRIQSINQRTELLTWYAVDRYEDPQAAQRALALFQVPTHRIGPIPAMDMPVFHTNLRVVQPMAGHPGGGLEASTYSAVWLTGLWNFPAARWDL